MDIQRCFKILELDRDASPDEAKQAYKDIVNVWHPDRFSNNPRLKQKAEEKLKEVNIAYEMVKSFLSSNDAGARDKTEVAVEVGTRLFLNVCSCLYTALHRLVVSQAKKLETEEKAKVEPGDLNQRQRQSRGNSRGKHRGGGKGRGKGMGKGRGRGKRGPQFNSGDF